MQEKKLLINQNDYELYTIPLSLRNLFGKQRNKSISSELNKLHPCFSDNCNFDSKLIFSKKGFQAKVLVVDNFSLKKYKEKYSLVKLYCKDFSNKALFEKSFLSKHKSLFVGIIVFLFICSLFTNLFWPNNKKSIVELNNTVDTTNIFQEHTSYPEIYSVTKNVLTEIRNCNGELSNFNWQINGFSEKLICNVKKIYPENLQSFEEYLTFSPLAYTEENPEFSITLSSTVKFPEIISSGNIFPKELIRQSIKKFNINLQKESVNPYELFFQGKIFEKKNNSCFFDDLAEICSKHNLLIDKIILNKSKDNIWNCQISFSETRIIEDNGILNLILTNQELFHPNFIIHTNSSNRKKEQVKENQLHKKQTTRDQKYISNKNPIGKVIHEDGSITSFYKTLEGKIEIEKN